jgi:hypothetical protein
MAAKKPAKKAAKSAGKAAKKIIRRAVRRRRSEKRMRLHANQSTYAEGEEREELPQCKGGETFENRGSPEDGCEKQGVKSAKPPVASSVPSGRPRGGRPARERKDQRPIPPMPAPGLANTGPMTTPPKVTPAPSPKDLAAAHEYLLARSATRSEAPLVVNGKRLPTEEELLKTRDATT